MNEQIFYCEDLTSKFRIDFIFFISEGTEVFQRLLQRGHKVQTARS